MILHHFGFASKSIEKSSQVYQILGYQVVSEIIVDPIQKVKLQFLKKSNDPFLELVEPLVTESPISKILEKNGSTLYHSCYEVMDIEIKIRELRKSGFVMVVKPIEAVAFEGRLISFLYNAYIGLIELLQK